MKHGSDDRFIEALHPDWTGALPFTLLVNADGEVERTWTEEVDEELLAAAIEHTLAAGEGEE
ncbi:hypothetical protein JYT86_00740 [bacterium AH-315-N03]|nr:hypothetical protein [bacterium AH-315-N03]